MSRKIAEELLPRLRLRYMGRGREGRSRLIDELSEQWGDSRKHAINRLGAKTGWGGDPGARQGRPPKYDREEEEVLWRIWKVSEQPCGKRLKALLPHWLPHYEVRTRTAWERSPKPCFFDERRAGRPAAGWAQVPCRPPWTLRDQARRASQNADPDPDGQLGHHPVRVS